MKRTKTRTLTAAAGVLGVTLAFAGTASAQPADPAPASDEPFGQPGTGQILPPAPDEDTMFSIPDWIGNGSAVTASVIETLPIAVTVGCQGGGSVQVHVGGLAPADFTVQCPVDSVGVGSVDIPARPGRDFQFTVHTSDPSIHWGINALQIRSGH
ncbi:hypothetical protein [Streptomyces sp. CB01881]|uniref:hypothetical protein n=1 Tax=Streptomyces sp. CB01881 TaxID=2078691 RepID=UPI000CDC7A32|nr:hypothetical protein [Streptomyces sp. CB01881]AUY53780.1 hypothetical protein C2142_38725 [Streptomyces sp. CB01881]TYC68789.1 hypothetical protein EH183_38715 [Streptomyces sp. CB01881]